LEDALKWIADDIARLLDRAPLVSVRSKTNRSGREDTVIHFYETFLKEYDQKLRELRGVYYTPQSVVSYIVRSLDKLLKSKFPAADGKPRFPEGLADPTVKILDPATGTGTFLAEVIKHIHGQFLADNNAGAWTADYIEEKLVPRLFAFELLVAPYTIAHLKLNLLLRDTCAAYTKGRGRLNVYLTNTLEPPQAHPELPLVEFVSQENNHGAQIKAREDILVILGNPPYSGHSANASKDARGKLTAIGKLLHGEPIIEADKSLKIKADAKKQPNYFQCDGKPLGERNPKWLNDDYVKFIRFAQWRIDRTGEGLVGFITNHGYLDNPTFRGMRQALMQSFDELYVLDLHGNDRKKEKTPEGGRDENVFDIQQGVAILLAVKRPAQPDTPRACRVYHADLWGKRSLNGGKYRYLYDHDVETTDWQEVKPDKPKHEFVVRDDALDKEYQQLSAISEITQLNALGPNSHRDGFAVAFKKQELMERFAAYRALESTEEAEKTFKLKDNRDWSIKASLSQIKQLEKWEENITKCLYRPFDERVCYYSQIAYDYHRPVVNDPIRKGSIALATTRQTRENFAVLVSDKLFGQHKICAKYDGSYVFPLYLYDDPNDPEARRPNFSDQFLETLAKRLGLSRVATPKPEDLAIIGMLPPEQPVEPTAEHGDSNQRERKGLAPSTDPNAPFGKGLAPSTDPNAPFGKGPAPSTDPNVTFGKGMPEGISPEDIFHYAYAVFHSPTYRTRYAEFLKIDFPRLPLTRSIRRFRALAELGKQLTALHLLDADAAEVLNDAPKRHPFPESGPNDVEKPQWKGIDPNAPFGKGPAPSNDPNAPFGKVFINQTQYFDNVPEQVWQHKIGGYQPAEKWLKDRKGRTLTSDDLAHYQKMLVAMAETQGLLPQIDEAIGEWPLR
jgi:predicted helicase